MPSQLLTLLFMKIGRSLIRIRKRQKVFKKSPLWDWGDIGLVSVFWTMPSIFFLSRHLKAVCHMGHPYSRQQYSQQLKSKKQLKHPSMDKRITTVCYMHTVDKPSKEGKLWHIPGRGWTMRVLHLVKSASHKRTNIVQFHLHEVP